MWWLLILGAAAALLLIKPTRTFLSRLVSRIRNFLNEVVEELKKASWPSRTELKNSTGLVILSMLMLAIFISLIDLILNAVVRLLVR